ncbi:MAG: type I restriction enzyme S subunit [Paraglaciecola sp.]|jgi:type I restriction enzyme S subunit
MVPSGWERKLLVKVAEIRTGVAKGKKGLKDPIEVPYLRVANVQDGHIDLTEIKTIEIERHQLERYSLLKGDVLMTEGGDFDKLGRGDVWQSQITPCLNQNHVFAVRVDKSEMEPYFLAALSGSHYGKTYFLSCAKRSTNLASINSTQLKQFPVLLPPLPEQRKISQVLSTWDKAISTTERLIDNSKQQKKALMQQTLTGKKRLLDYSGKLFDGEWEKHPIGKLCKSIVPGRNKPKLFEGNIPWVTTPEFQGRFIPSKLQKNYISQSTLSDCGGKLVPKGAVVMAAVGELGLTAIATESLVLNQQLHAFVCNKNINNVYLSYWLANQKPYMESVASKTTIMYMNKTNCESIPVLIPSILEQQKIASLLTNADKKIELLERQLADLKQEKKALMQQLLTGKRRVKLDEKEVA